MSASALTKSVKMSSSFSDSQSEVWKPCPEVEHNTQLRTQTRRKNPKTEDKKIYRAANSGETYRVFRTIKRLVPDSFNIRTGLQSGNFSRLEILMFLFKHLKSKEVALLANLQANNAMEGLEELIMLELHFHGPDLLRGLILFLTCVERPERIDLIKKLLHLGCNINAKDSFNRNILHRLAHEDFPSKRYLQVAELLIKEGIDMTAMNMDDETPMESAVVNQKLDLVRLFLRNGATMVSDYEHVAECAFMRQSTACLHAIIKFYLLKKMQGKEVDEGVMNFIKTKELSEHYNVCLESLEDLKQNILNTEVSIHDILFKPKEHVVKYMRNEYIQSEIERYIMESSEYSYEIAEIRDEAVTRMELEESTTQVFEDLFKLPKSCSEIIISHLDNDDLKSASCLGKYVCQETKECEPASQSCSSKKCAV